MISVALFTRDLRLADNPVLMAAGQQAVPLFVQDPDASARHGSPNRSAFLAESLRDLDAGLRDAGSSLVVRTGPFAEVVAAVVEESGAESVHMGRDVSAFAQRRLAQLEQALSVPVETHDSITVIPPDAIAPASGPFYQVFTPYYRSWSEVHRRTVLDAPTNLSEPGIDSEPLPEMPTVDTSPARLSGGETEARRRLHDWLPRARSYGDTRDALAEDGTSMLSADLHLGTLSPLEVSLVASEAGAEAFVRQLAWRDFYSQVLYHRPESSWSNYRGGTVAWNRDDEGFAAWTSGLTGFPVVDAGMRQLAETGWMHNRARMITASFLTKDLMIDWRRGARWFLSSLTDGDVANNQLGWQWVAGTGTDTNPTRIFNPTIQSKRFDPAGAYIRRWVPELADVEDAEIHDPSPLTRASTGYPLPIVDHRDAIRRYKEARGFKV